MLLHMQGLTMDLSVGPHAQIASASLSCFDSFAIIIMVRSFKSSSLTYPTKARGAALCCKGTHLLCCLFVLASEFQGHFCAAPEPRGWCLSRCPSTTA